MSDNRKKCPILTFLHINVKCSCHFIQIITTRFYSDVKTTNL